MKMIISRIIVLILVLPILINAQQDVTLSINSVSGITGNPPPNFVEDTGGTVFLRYYYNQYGQLTGINNYFYITNTGGPGIINIEIIVDEFTEHKQFSVAGSTSYALVTSVPVWQGPNVSSVISTVLPGVQLDITYNGISATGVSGSTLDPGSAPRDWYWFESELWDYENITFGNNMFAIVGENGKIFTSFDSQSWELKDSETNEDLSGIAFGNGQWVATAWDGNIFTSENTRTWIERTVVTDWLSGVAYGSGRYVAVGGGIHTSVDGITWNELGTDSYNFSGINYVNNTFVAVGDGIYTSAAGTSWTQVLPQPSDTHLSGITYGNGVYVAVGWIWVSGNRGNGVVYTSSNGSTWTKQSLNVSGVNGLDKVDYGNGKFMAVGLDGAIIESTDGITWASVSSGTTDPLTGVAFGSGQFIVVGTGGGTILKYGELTHISNNSTSIPSQYILYQNYPNPFNPSTTIEFFIPHRAFVVLKVYNILGESAAVLVSEELSAGYYSFPWNAASLPSGVYLYKLQTGEFSHTKKMLLLE